MCVYARVCACMCVFMCMCMCVYVRVYVVGGSRRESRSSKLRETYIGGAEHPPALGAELNRHPRQGVGDLAGGDGVCHCGGRGASA